MPPLRVSTSAGIAMMAVMALASGACAGGDVVLFLPLSRALALVDRPAVGPTGEQDTSSRWRGPTAGAPPPPPAFIPSRIHIPELYKLDFERDAPRFAEPVDNDRMVSFEVVPPARLRPSFSFRFDKESLPLGSSSSRLSIECELPF
jgi:hypothetical protein